MSIGFLLAQNYQSFNSKRTYSYNQFMHVGFSSASFNGKDSILTTYNDIWRNDSLDYWNNVDGSFIGKQVIIGGNGFDVFFNKEQDSIKIIYPMGF